MRKVLISLAALGIVGAIAGVATMAVSSDPEIVLKDLEVGKPAPAFAATDANGKLVNLADYKGKTVVLEWNNPGCPYVKKQYDSGAMQQAQAVAARDGVVWLTINSGAPGKQGHMDGAKAKAFVAQAKATPAAYLLDPEGKVGRTYGAKTTPHMYVINGDGALVYAGAINNTNGSDDPDIEVRNHVLAALAEVKAGKPVSVPSSRPFGCSVKYSA